MRKRRPGVEWYIAESDAEWERLRWSHVDGESLSAYRCVTASRYLGASAAFLLLLVVVGGWWWPATQTELPQAKADMQVARIGVTLHAIDRADGDASSGWGLQSTRADNELGAVIKAELRPGHFGLDVRVLAPQGDQAIVNVRTAATADGPAYRQTRFYQRTATGWQPAAPNVDLWGPERNLETPSFVFRFRQRDAPAVIAVATQVETLYTSLGHNVGVSFSPEDKKLVIDVRVTETPGHASLWFGTPERIVVSSPAIYLAPVALTDTELLVQSIALSLIDAIIAQASEHYAITSAWQPMLRGVRLWQVWDLDLPLAAWRPDVVQWLYTDLLTEDPGQSILLPERYQKICDSHKLWLLSPLQIDIPLVCVQQERENEYLSLWSRPSLATHLDQIGVPVFLDDDMVQVSGADPVSYSARTIVLATLIEYAVVTYGREHLPALMAGLGQYKNWDTLLPAVYGMSPTEFEAGWQTYLATHYGR